MKDKAYVLIEGDDDEKFFKKVLEPVLKNNYEFVLYWTYAQETKALFEKMIISINKEGKDYYILGDLDGWPSIKDKINDLVRRSNNRAVIERIMIVVRIMEGWYLAGITDDEKEKLGITMDLSNTEIVTIQIFNDMESNFTSKKLLKNVILQNYHKNIAIKRNSSFKYSLDLFNNL